MADIDLQVQRSNEVDRGFAWVIMVATFISNILCYGVAWSTGVLYVIFLTNLDYTHSTQVALGSALNSGIMYSIGPVAGLLTNRLGCRRAGMLGGLIAGIGLLGTTFSANVYYMCLVFGAVTGAGFGICFITSITEVTLYFDKYRSIALGVSTSGIGIGVLIYPPLIRVLYDWYGYKGNFIILAGITFNLIVCAATYRPPPQHPVTLTMAQSVASLVGRRPGRVSKFSDKDGSKYSLHYPTIHSRNSLNVQVYSSKINIHHSKLSLNYTQSKNSLHVPTHLSSASVQDKQSIRKISTNNQAQCSKHSTYTPLHLSKCSVASPLHVSKNSVTSSVHSKGSFPASLDLEKKLIFTSEPPTKGLNLSIFLNLDYTTLCVNHMLICFALSAVHVHLAAYAESIGVSETNAVWLFSTVGVANFVGRLAYGGIELVAGVEAITLHTGGFLLCGVATILMPFISSDYLFLHLYAGVFGLLTASIGTMTASMLCEFIGPEMMANGYGNLMIFEALGQVLGAPVASALHTYTKVYATSFYFGGASFIMASVMMFLPMIRGGNCHKPSWGRRRDWDEDGPRVVEIEEVREELH